MLVTRTDPSDALIGYVVAVTPFAPAFVAKRFHALVREGTRNAAPAPTPEEAALFLRATRNSLSDVHVAPPVALLNRVRLSQVREQIEAGEYVVDGPVWYAWNRLVVSCALAIHNREQAVIFDIDGTLSNNEPMRHVPLPPPGPDANYDEWMSHTVHLNPNEWVRDATHEVGEGVVRIILTARSEKYRPLTIEWLTAHNVAYDLLVMRPDGNIEPDWAVKQEALDELELTYDILFAMDDNPEVSGMWTANNIDTIVVPGFATNHNATKSLSETA